MDKPLKDALIREAGVEVGEQGEKIDLLIAMVESATITWLLQDVVNMVQQELATEELLADGTIARH